MARTKADGASRAVGAKSFRKTMSTPRSASSSSSPASRKTTKGGKSSGGNSYCPRPTPSWQKEIANFLAKPKVSNDEQESSEGASSSDACDSSASGSSSS
ncbi:PCNA-associated factor-like [Amblyomma americanum]|uniref:PCNA-associated factor n=1 Tax=Amblyomma americanum TaxID=6943 RepID=A0A0C9SA38_AMBAM